MQLHQHSDYLFNAKIVKTALLSTLAIMTGSFLTIAVPEGASPQSVQNNTSTIQFYCGKAQDLSSRSTLPATVVKVSGSQEEPVLIIWKSEAFAKFTPQQRCETVSPKFQAALQQGRNYLSTGIDQKSGIGIICAVANAEQACDRNTMLFTLKSYQDADTTVQQILEMLTGTIDQPTYQSSGKQMPDLRSFARLRKK